MNYHDDLWAFKCLRDHLEDARDHFPDEQIVGIFCQGSTNYGMDCENSDFDTKLIVVPSFKDIALNKKPVSTTHVRLNDEHIDFKDIRLYIETFRKQNLNFLEILFTKYYWINPLYIQEWERLIKNNEMIAHMNPYRAVKSMKGIALEKFHAMEHEYPSKIEIIKKYGYDCKQLHHLVRVEEYLARYIRGDLYGDCLYPEEENVNFIMDCKLGKYNLEQARELAKISLKHIETIADEFCTLNEDKENEQARELLEDVSYNIMKIAVKEELM